VTSRDEQCALHKQERRPRRGTGMRCLDERLLANLLADVRLRNDILLVVACRARMISIETERAPHASVQLRCCRHCRIHCHTRGCNVSHEVVDLVSLCVVDVERKCARK
jgi:hypothetical protein